MKKMLAFLIAVWLLTLSAIAQKIEHATTKKLNWGNGTITLQSYTRTITQLRYLPNGYTKNEQLSDAVIAKPIYGKLPDYVLLHDTLFIGKGRSIAIVAPTNQPPYNGFRILLHEKERIYGGGERAIPLNRRGHRFDLYNNPWYGYSEGADNLNYSVPFFTSSNGYGLFFNNPSKGYVDIGKSDANFFEYGAISGALELYIIFGNTPAEILQGYYGLTGTQPLPPRWAMGNLMSRFGYTSQAQVEDIVARSKAAGIPLDAVIFDLFWFGDSIKGTMGNLDWKNTNKWPNHKAMIGKLNNAGIKSVLITEPFMLQSTSNYTAATPYLAIDSNRKPYELNDFYFGKAGLIDIFRKDAQNWFWQFYKKQMNLGVEAWWGDLGEPEKHPSNLWHQLKDYGYKRNFSADEVHNLYGHTWTKMLYQKYAQYYPEKRLFSLNRSGFAGTQHYGIFPWSGDVSRSWSGLRAQLPIMLGMSMSGVPYIHADAGGFAGGEGDYELYIRWLQFAAFTPIFRPHGTMLGDIEKQAFSFPSEPVLMDSPYQQMAKDIVNLRYEMLPYNYTLAYQQTKMGKPLVAPLYYYYPKDTIATAIEDEYMWGENILVAPVLQKGATSRKLYLPKGKWATINTSTTQIIEGESWITDSVALVTIPLFLKEGGFVVTNTGEKTTQTQQQANYFVHYNASTTSSSYTLFEDDGSTKGSLEKGIYSLIQFKSAGISNHHLHLTIASINGTFKGIPLNRKFTFSVKNLTNKVRAILVNGQPTVHLDGRKKMGKMQKDSIISIESNGSLTISYIHFTSKPIDIDIQF